MGTAKFKVKSEKFKNGKRQILKQVQNDKTFEVSLAPCGRGSGEGYVVLRIIDANLNRCREGLRVIEDCLRYVLNDGVLYKKARSIRHNTDKILRTGYASLIKERDTITDSGREMPETVKKNLSGIIIANFKRVQESLRVLEEYSKTTFPESAPLFKKQRYAAYNLEKAVYLKYSKTSNFALKERK